MRRLRPAMILGLLLLSTGCGIQPWVKPYERDRLADPIMAWDRDALSSAYLDHVREAREDRAAPPAARAAAAAAIDAMPPTASRQLIKRAALVALLIARVICADVLPDDRADLFYSKYSGGGMDITGESVLVRKKVTDNFAVEANYFVDKVSGASVDVLSQASVIKDERKQKTITAEFMHDKTTYSLSYINSTERDYISNTTHASLSQSMFGDLTTLTLGWGLTRDGVGENDGTAFVPRVVWLGHAESRSYSGGLSQIITKNFIAGLNFEVDTDDGYLANPYRSVRYFDPTNAKGYSLASQVYPDTRTSTAIQLQAKYYLPWRAALTGSYRYYNDTWDVTGHTYELDYTHPLGNIWILEGRLRYYKQSHASFYSDIFPSAGYQNFEARDQDLASSENTTIGAKVTYAFLPDGWKIFKRGTATFDISRINFHYLDFTDIRDYGLPEYQPGDEPLYHFTATVYQIYMSMFF